MTGFNNNNNSGGNTGGVSPDRLQELMERVRRSEEQNQQLRGQVDVLTRQTMAPKNTTPRQSKFAPEVQAAIDDEIRAKVEEIVTPLQQQFQNQSGWMMEQLDSLNFQTQYASKPTYAKYVDKVEQVRKDAQASGQWLSREQALQYVYFQETGKKPAPENTAEATAKAPHFDTFLGQYVDDKGNIVQPQATPTVEQLQQPPPGQTQPQQQAQPNQQFQQQPQAQQPMAQQPQQFEQPEQFTAPQLPNMNPPQGAPRAPSGQHFGVDVGSDEKALQQWEQRYGDVPF